MEETEFRATTHHSEQRHLGPFGTFREAEDAVEAVRIELDVWPGATIVEKFKDGMSSVWNEWSKGESWNDWTLVTDQGVQVRKS